MYVPYFTANYCFKTLLLIEHISYYIGECDSGNRSCGCLLDIFCLFSCLLPKMRKYVKTYHITSCFSFPAAFHPSKRASFSKLSND